MRTIKFRIWDKICKEFARQDDLMEYSDFDVCYFNNLFDQKDYIFQQFTGLHDKNGREIYEGDLVKYSFGDFSYIEKIGWEGVGFRLVTINDDSSNCLAGMDSICEVVGNIFENAELIK